ncbi:(2Fe-2S)-binding protein [Roseomonas sp. CECT 9278]|uniref:(2Fe-2S)-binding protein n=1 Tax=Roseomonas sp. CECT 9278 TaxID=2845823 RepID=UPI001E58125F|nr:(2Fe-2S)-binding protein [Roseomonas sp. CECT 9278]CAH0161565.1 Hydrogen cyanide synthase subunit HcnA [Roseomonas sp. CECT 9278]
MAFRLAAGADAQPMIEVTLDGAPCQARATWTVADLLLAAGVTPYRRSAVSGAARAPFCMMGSCFDCLVTIDGVPDSQGCLRRLAPGMRIERQAGPA